MLSIQRNEPPIHFLQFVFPVLNAETTANSTNAVQFSMSQGNNSYE